jgi:hypothetical protein
MRGPVPLKNDVLDRVNAAAPDVRPNHQELTFNRDLLTNRGSHLA